MFSLDHINKSSKSQFINFSTTSTIYHRLSTTQKQQNNAIPLNITNRSHTLAAHQRQNAFDEPYSVTTGIRTAILLSVMLLLVIIHLLWKSRSRLRRCLYSSANDNNDSHMLNRKFDLDYWLQQVDILEEKEAARNRECLSPYLELPLEPPRNVRAATAEWILDTYRQWCLMQYLEQNKFIHNETIEKIESNPLPQLRRNRFLYRFIRRFRFKFNEPQSFSIQYSPSFYVKMRLSIINNNLSLPITSFDRRIRRVQSWPRLDLIHYRNASIDNYSQEVKAGIPYYKEKSKNTSAFV